MTKNYLGYYNLLAVSANNKETAINTEQTLDTSMLVSMSDVLQLVPRREDNSDELTGKEEPDTVYDLGALSEGPMTFNKAQAQHFAFGYAYGLGVVASAAWGTGYEHTITPTGDMVLPSFTAAMKIGKTIMKRRLASMFIDTLTTTFEKDSWAKHELGLKGTGKYDTNMTKETVNAQFDATSLTLAANAVEGSDAATRLDNVHSIRAKDVSAPNAWIEVSYSVVSAATPAVITISAPGGVATLTDYEIIYVPAEPAWCTFPSRVTEPPLRVTDLVVTLGGVWDGSTFSGGRTIDTEIESIVHSLNNQQLIEYRVGGTGSYANYALRLGRMQTLTLNRQARDYILQQKILDNEYFGVYMKATGAEFESGKNYYVEFVFPRCNVLKSPISINNKIIAEAGDLKVLEDDTYGSIRVKVGNKVATYAA